MPAVKRNRGNELFWRLHRAAFAATGGRIGSRVLGMPTLKLTTVGRAAGSGGRTC